MTRPKLEFRFSGDGIDPGQVPAKDLIALLQAAVGLARSVSEEANLDAPDLALVKIRPGSAVYAFQAVDPQRDDDFGRIAESTHRAVRTRGEHNRPATRDALLRLYSAGSVGPIKVGAVLANGTTKPATLMAQPLKVAPSSYYSATVLHGRITGLAARAAGYEVILKPEDGGARITLYTSDDGLADRLARLFNRRVRLEARFERTTDCEVGRWVVEAANSWEPAGSFIDFMAAIGEELHSKGIVVSSAEHAKFLAADSRGDQ